ncbi:MAG: isoprenylcysteine carboxylmethyltransferase family protein [Planctomycetes bacterium]|nr:isoprenylcysteine carboxylmethyltransferase family protein [Planctomycetota bacterium]
MMRVLFLLYGLAAYLLFFVATLYGIGFVGNLWVPKGIDDGVPTTIGFAIVVNVALLLLFAVQHNIMARRWFKDWWTRFVPRPIERSTYVAAASLILLLLFWQWRPIPETVWHVDGALGRWLLWALYFLGWAIVFYSSFVIDHFELFGLKQVWMHFMGREPQTAPFSERSIYRWVRHPLMLGFILAFWSAPTMSLGRLLFAVVTTVWILIAIQIEERDLAEFLGEPYRNYRKRTPMLVPWPRSKRRNED